MPLGFLVGACIVWVREFPLFLLFWLSIVDKRIGARILSWRGRRRGCCVLLCHAFRTQLWRLFLRVERIVAGKFMLTWRSQRRFQWRFRGGLQCRWLLARKILWANLAILIRLIDAYANVRLPQLFNVFLAIILSHYFLEWESLRILKDIVGVAILHLLTVVVQLAGRLVSSLKVGLLTRGILKEDAWWSQSKLVFGRGILHLLVIVISTSTLAKLVLFGVAKTVIKFMHAVIVEIFMITNHFSNWGFGYATGALIILVEVSAVILFRQLFHVDHGVVLVKVDGWVLSFGLLALLLHEGVEDEAFCLSEGRHWMVPHLGLRHSPWRRVRVLHHHCSFALGTPSHLFSFSSGPRHPALGQFWAQRDKAALFGGWLVHREGSLVRLILSCVFWHSLGRLDAHRCFGTDCLPVHWLIFICHVARLQFVWHVGRSGQEARGIHPGSVIYILLATNGHRVIDMRLDWRLQLIVGFHVDRALFDAPQGSLVHQSLVALVTIRVQSSEIGWAGGVFVLHHGGHQVLVIRTDLLQRTKGLRRSSCLIKTIFETLARL